MISFMFALWDFVTMWQAAVSDIASGIQSIGRMTVG